MNRFHLRAGGILAVVITLSACDDSTTPPDPPTLTVAPETQSIQVGEALQLSAEFNDPSGDLDATDIGWESLEPMIATVTGSGRVVGVRPGEARIVAAAGGAADTSRIEVLRTPGDILIDPVAALAPGDVIDLTAVVLDTDGEPMEEVDVQWSVAPEELASVDSEGRLTAHQEGEIVITASAPPVTESVEAEIRDIPPPPGCDEEGIRLRVGETRTYPGGELLSLCLDGSAEYALIAANAADSSAVTDFRGLGTAAPAAPSTALAALIPARRTLSAGAALAPTLDTDFERRLRRWERERLSPRAARSRAVSRSLQAGPTARAVGDLLHLNTSTSCEAPDSAVGRVEYVGERSLVVADTANPSGITREHYERFGTLFDTLLYPVVTEAFGEPAGLNGETRIVIFYTRAVNELTPAGSDGVVGGFFWAADLFPTSVCRGSNEREMFYMLAPDPEGEINGNVRTVSFVERMTAGTIAHELQHLINASRRIYVNDAETLEEPWLNEGLSHIAEELVYYDQSGNRPRQNIDIDRLRSSQQQVDAANSYALSNMFRLDRYLRGIEREGPFQNDDDLATRGASWQFLRYALDRDDRDDRSLLANLVDSRIGGIANFETVFGIDIRDWFVDDAVALFADEYVAGVADEHEHPSWDFRSILDFLNDDGFIISTRPLRDGELATVRLEPWGAAYIRTAVGPGRVGQVVVGTGEAPPPESVRFVLLRTR